VRVNITFSSSGEGTVDGKANVTEALELYEEAAEKGSVTALNGLGYAYFFGQVSPKL